MSTRTRRWLAAAAVVAACIAIVPASASAAPAIPANDPSSSQLVERPVFYNGKTITFTGEAIGERMVRGDRAWIHLNDDAYMERNVEEGAKLGGFNSGMAVWVPASATDPIDTYGDYKHEGSIVQVRGVFNKACKEHGGDMDIHAESVRVLRAGHPAKDPVKPWKAAVAAALVLLAAAAFAVDRATRNRIAPQRRR